MRNLPLLIVILLALTFSCKQSRNEKLDLNSGWQFSQSQDTSWMSANVPGTVQTDLIRLKKIKDPFIGTNEDSIQWISEKNWTYKKSFSVPDELLTLKKHYLQFDGLDTYALVYLNDSLILSANNAFRRWEIDISNCLKPNNELFVHFKNTDSIEIIEANKLTYELPEAPRVYTRKPQFQYGWDWGPTIKTMGIWRDVNIISFDALRLNEAFLKTKSITDTLAEITAQISIETLEPNDITVEIKNENTNEINSFSVEVTSQSKEYEFPLFIKNPHLWWVHNLGDPYLYEFTISIKRKDRVIDSISKKVGIRSIELITEKDKAGERFYFELNGVPVYMKGANYIPQNIFLPEVSSTHTNTLLDDVVAANMNMLRVWGGGIYEADEFYALCDEKGILIWQDFMFACAMYPGDSEFLANVKQEAIDNVKRLRQHPSIALWCGNNENSEGWHRWGWQNDKTERQKKEIWSNYYALFNDILPKIVDSLHPSVDYWESSPKYGRGDTRYQYEGDAHDWWVWHDGYPFEHFEENVPRFMSEFGLQSFPSHEVIQYLTEQDTIDLKHPSILSHQKHSRGFQLINDYMRLYYPIPKNAEDYIYVSQLVQAYGITKAIHAHRRAKPYNMGSLYWQLNDCWPAISWSSIDGLGHWKALHYKATHAFENLIISCSEKNNTIGVQLVNDGFSDVTDTLTLSLQDLSGNILFEEQLKVTSTSNSSELVHSFNQDSVPFNPNSTFLKINFSHGEFIHYFVKPKDLDLQNKEILSTIQKTESGFSISLTSSTLQKDVFLVSRNNGKWSDNFFDLLPNETKTIMFLTKESTTPNIEIKTLNKLN